MKPFIWDDSSSDVPPRIFNEYWSELFDLESPKGWILGKAPHLK
jgi:hypothetical protein